MKKYILIFTLFFSLLAHASLEIGAGTTSATAGRLVPALNTSLTWGDSALSAFSTGVQTEYYYHSHHGLVYYKTWKAGTFGFGEVRSGFGGGVTVSSLGYQDEGSTTEATASDFTIGPAFHVNWTLFSGFYMNIEGIYGIRDLGPNLTLNYQDTVTLSFGVRIL